MKDISMHDAANSIRTYLDRLPINGKVEHYEGAVRYTIRKREVEITGDGVLSRVVLSMSVPKTGISEGCTLSYDKRSMSAERWNFVDGKKKSNDVTKDDLPHLQDIFGIVGYCKRTR